MNKSTEIKELLSALFEVQLSIKSIPMHGFNPHFKSKFAKLPDIIDELKSTCSLHGLMITQLPGMEEIAGQLCVIVETVVLHVDTSQWLSAYVSCPAPLETQKVGAAITYLRRFGLVSLFFLKEEDDDGESVATKSPEKNYSDEKVSTRKVPPLILQRILSFIMAQGISEETQDKWLKHFKVDSLVDLTEVQAQKLIDTLEKKI